MSKRTKRYYAPEFKEQALEMLATGNYTITELEEKLDITAGRLGDWKRKKEKKGRHAKKEQTTETESAETAQELRRLERENLRLRQERDILKKAVAIFSNPK